MEFAFATSTVIDIALGVAALVLIAWIIRLELKLRRLLGGSAAQDLEEMVRGIHKALADIERFREHTEHILREHNKRLQGSVRGMHTVRFKAFQGDGSGGNQSFATALMDEGGNGVVLSSLYSRERISVFAKPVRQGASEYELSEEEREALEKAKERVAR